MRAHAELSPSSAYRWMECPGSAQMSRGVPRFTSEYAAEGTAAHNAAEICIRRGLRPSMLLGQTISGFEVDYEMCGAFQVYVDYVLDASLGALSWGIEQTITLESLNPPVPMHGFLDAYVLRPLDTDPRWLELEIIDYKHGRGVAVSPVRNPQAMYYALGGLLAHPPATQKRVANVKITIIQPRESADGMGIKTWSCTPAELHMFTADLFMSAAATQEPDAPLVPGDHCRFCPGLPVCPAVANAAVEAAQATFADGLTAEPPAALYAIKPAAEPLTASSPKIPLSDVLDAIDGFLDDWAKAVKTHALNLLESAQDVPGYKLVDKRGTRSWRDEAEAEKWLRTAAKLKVTEIRPPGKMISPAQAEALVGKKAIPEGMILKRSSGHTIAPVSDPRPPAVPDLPLDGTEFED